MVWSDIEHEKCVKNIERLVLSTHRNHEIEYSNPSLGANIPTAQLALLRSNELNELKLLVEAVKGKDIIGVTSLCAAFWSHKNTLVRQKLLLERALPPKQRAAEIVGELKMLRRDVEASVSVSERKQLERTNMDLNNHIAAIESADFGKLCEVSAQLHKQLAAMADDAASRQLALMGVGDRQDREQSGERDENTVDRAQSIAGVVGESLNLSRAKLVESLQMIENLRENALGIAAGAGVGNFGPCRHPGSPTEPWQLVRYVPIMAEAGSSLEQVAKKAGVEPQNVLLATTGQPVRSLVKLGEAREHREDEEEIVFRKTTSLLGQIVKPVKGLDTALLSIERRIRLLEETTLPNTEDRSIVAKEELWQAEVENLNNPLRQHDSRVPEARQALDALTTDIERLKETIRQCKAHRAAIENADIEMLSSMLEEKEMDVLSGLGAGERLVYACKEVPSEQTLEQFASSMGVLKQELFTFTDESTGRLMAYVPTMVSRSSLVSLDAELRREIEEAKSAFPDAPPRVDLLEELAALRSGDVATLARKLAEHRRNVKNSAWNVQIDQLRKEVAELQVQIQEEHEKVERANRRGKTISEEKQALAEKQETLVKQLSEEQSQVRKGEREILALKEQLARLEADSQTETQRLNRKISDLSTNLTAAHLKLEEVERAEGDAREKIGSLLEGRIAQLEIELLAAEERERTARSDFTEAKAGLQRQIRDLQEQLAAAREDAASALETAKLNGEQEVQSLKQATNRLEADLSAARKETRTSNHVIGNLREEIAQLAAANEALSQKAEETARAPPRTISDDDTMLLRIHELQEKLNEVEDERDQLKKMSAQDSQRIVYICRDVAQGTSHIDEAKRLNIDPDDIIPFFDELTGKYHIYVPTQVPRASIKDQDRIVTERIIEAKAAASPGGPNKQAFSKDGVLQQDSERSSAVGAAPWRYVSSSVAAAHEAALCEHRSALRAGDTAAMSIQYLELTRAVTKLEEQAHSSRRREDALRAELVALKQQKGVGLVGWGGEVDPSLLEGIVEEGEENGEFFTAEVAIRKIKLLQEELKKVKWQNVQWKQMCEEYRAGSSQLDAASALEHVKNDFTKRLRAVELKLEMATERLAAEQDEIKALQRKNEAERESFESTRKQLISDSQRAQQGLAEEIEEERKRSKSLAQENASLIKQVGQLKMVLQKAQQYDSDDD